MKFHKKKKLAKKIVGYFFNMSMDKLHAKLISPESGPGWTFCLNCLQGVKVVMVNYMVVDFILTLKSVITLVVFSCGSGRVWLDPLSAPRLLNII